MQVVRGGYVNEAVFLRHSFASQGRALRNFQITKYEGFLKVESFVAFKFELRISLYCE